MAILPATTQTTAQGLGTQLRGARRARGLSLRALADRTGLSVRFLSELEHGKEGASLGRVLQVAGVLGVSLPVHLEPHARVDVERYPALRSLLWQRRGERFLDEEEALAVYEANWRFVEPDLLLPREVALIRELARRHGHGVLNV